MKVYLSGKMRGLPEENTPMFNRFAKTLRDCGYEVFNPAETVPRDDWTVRDWFSVDCEWICRHAEAIFMMPGWEDSKGARAEHALALALGLKVMYA